MRVQLEILKGNQIGPANFSDGLKGDFVKINRCRDCESVGDTHELFYLEPCPECGGKIDKNIGVAKWDKKTENWQMRTGFIKENEEPKTEGFYSKDEAGNIKEKEPKGLISRLFGGI